MALSLATTSSREGPVNLIWRRDDDPELPDDEAAGASATFDAFAVGLLLRLLGRELDPPVSDCDVSSLRNDGNLDEVDILDGLAETGWSSEAELLFVDLLPSKKGVIKDPLAMKRGGGGEARTRRWWSRTSLPTASRLEEQGRERALLMREIYITQGSIRFAVFSTQHRRRSPGSHRRDRRSGSFEFAGSDGSPSSSILPELPWKMRILFVGGEQSVSLG